MALGACLVIGCAHTHLERNAPGHVDVRAPPEDLRSREPEQPGDPGERLLTASVGAFAGLGWASPADGRFDYGVGPELSVSLGERPSSHYEDDFFLLPARSFGLHLGLSAVDAEGSGLGPAFAELAFSETLTRLSVGYAVDVGDERNGPQATLAMGPLYLRATHLFSYGTSVHLGLALFGSHSWVWSQ